MVNLIETVYRAYKSAVKTGSQQAKFVDALGAAINVSNLWAEINGTSPRAVFPMQRVGVAVEYTMPREDMMTALLTFVKPVLAKFEAMIAARLRSGTLDAANMTKRIRGFEKTRATVRAARYADNWLGANTVAARKTARIARRAARVAARR